jgi:hypothetical protein
MYRMESKRFVINTLLISLIYIFTGIYFFTFEHTITQSIYVNDLENATDTTINDISDVTKSKPTNKYKDKKFVKDAKVKDDNRNLAFYWIIASGCITIILFSILYSISNELKNDVKNIIFNLLVVKIVELYFIFTFKRNFKDQTIDGVRKSIIEKFKEI